jgi:adenylate kinase family enzyme
MQRVSIVGCPGAGKSTFARALAKKTGLPLYHLDYFYHQKGKDYEHNKQAWLDTIGELTHQDSWIIEGNYGSSYAQRIPMSDTLIFMDMPSWLSTWSVLKRRLQYRRKKRQEMPDDWKEKLDPEFFKYVLLFRIKSRKDVVDGIERYRHKALRVVTFKSRKAAYRWLGQLDIKNDK